MDFQGTFDHTLDAKNRLTVPSAFRAALAGGAVIAKGLDTCATVWVPSDRSAYVNGALEGFNPLSDEVMDLARFFNANAWATELDAAGRIMVPGKVLEWAGLRKDVVVLGAGRCIELWDRESYAAVDAPDPATLRRKVQSLLGQAPRG
jgi:MraZ protein